MSAWKGKKIDSTQLNNGNRYDKNSQVSIEQLNSIVEGGIYMQEFAEHLADSPDTSEVNNVGTPEVSIVETIVDGVSYKKFKFKNLKGDTGAKGDKGDTGETGPQGKVGATFTYYEDTGMLVISTE